MQVPATVSRAHWLLSAARYRPWMLAELARFSQRPVAARRRRIAEALLRQIRLFGTRADALPEWREAARIRDADSLLREFPSLPIVTKSMLRERFPAAEVAKVCGLRGRVGSSGGSTGEPTHFFHDDAMLASGEAKALYTRLRLGWRPGMATICVWGSDRDIGKDEPWRARAVRALRREHLLAGYRLGPDTAREFVALVTAHAPVVAYGFTSMLTDVARLALDLGLRVPRGAIRVAWNGGEGLDVEQSELFRRAFGVGLHNVYGGRELSTIAAQVQLGSSLEVLRPLSFVEIVDDAGRPVEPGSPGRLLVTSTVCCGTPFLRYEVGDMAVADPAATDASGIGALAEISGRRTGILRLPTGATIQNIYWNHLFKEYPEVHQFQVVVRDGELLLRLRGSGFSRETEHALRAQLSRVLGPTPVKLEWLPELPRTALGKLLQVVDERRSGTGPGS